MKKIVIAASLMALAGCSTMEQMMKSPAQRQQEEAAQKAAADRAAAQQAAAQQAAQKAAADRAAAEQAAQKAAADRAAAERAVAQQAAAQQAAQQAAQKAAADRAAAEQAAQQAARVLTDAERFQEVVSQLANQLNRNMGRRTGQKFIVTSFTDLNRISESSGMGQLLSEQLINQLQVRGWDLVELRLSNSVAINSAGEFGLSREHRRLKEQFQASGIITGTYSVAGRDILVNARVMNFETGAVVSSAQVRVPMTAFVEELAYSGKHQSSTVRIVGGSEAR